MHYFQPPKLIDSNANDLNITLLSRGGHYNDRQPQYSHVAPLRLMGGHRTIGVPLPYSEDVTTIAVQSGLIFSENILLYA